MKFTPGESNIICSDLARSRKFYEEILGFTFVEEDSGAVRLSLGNRFYLLLPVASEKKASTPYCSIPEISLDLQVKDAKAAFEYLQSKDVNIVQDLDAEKSWFVIADPDGNHWEIVQKKYQD